jgi:hypothetical protein
MAKLSWEYITIEATSTSGMNRKQFLQFHRFNDNGIEHQYYELRKKLFEAVESKKCKSGALLAFSFDFYSKTLQKLLKSSQPSWLEINSIFNQATDEYNSLVEFLGNLE